MGNLIVYNSDEACILYIKKRNYIYMSVEGYLNRGKIQGFIKSSKGFCSEKGINKILFDTSKLNPDRKNNLGESIRAIIDEIVFFNPERIAFLCPKNSWGYQLLYEILKEAGKGNTKMLGTLEEAEDWLFSNVPAKVK
jgi:hypothetical protein